MDAQQYEQLSKELEQLFYKGAFEEAKKLAFSHYEKAIRAQNDYVELQMLRYMMMASANLGQYEVLLHFFERYEYLCHSLKDEQCLLFFNIYLMFIYNHQGYYEQSMYVLKRACRMALEKKNQLAIIEAFSNACATATLLKQYDHAIQYALIGMTHLDDSMRHSIFTARIEMNLSIALIYNGQHSLAYEYLERNRSIIEDEAYARFVKDQAQYYRAKALLAEHEHDYLAAKVYLKQALTLLLRHANVADLVHLIRANIHLAKILHDDAYFAHASNMLQTFVNSAAQQRIDDIASLNVQRHVARDQRGTQTVDETIGVYRAKGAYTVVNQWLSAHDTVECAAIMLDRMCEKDARFLQITKAIHETLNQQNIIVGFNAQQVLIFWRNANTTQIKRDLATVSDIAKSHDTHALIGRSKSTANTLYAKELYNFAYAQLYYMRELDAQMLTSRTTH